VSDLAVHVLAFGYSAGLPAEAELVVDVRFLSNPNYVDALRPLTGADRPVVEFMQQLPETKPFLVSLYAFVDFLLPQYARAGKSRVTVAIGCTGGRHRSVFVAEHLAAHLRSNGGMDVSLSYRELAAA
jgi:RNase adapter protein RapZ